MVEGQLADLVEEHGAAVRALEHAGERVGRAGEGTALVAEELALDQILGDGAAVEHLERAALARRVARAATRPRAPCRRRSRR